MEADLINEPNDGAPMAGEIEDEVEGVLDVDPDQEVWPLTYDITSFGVDFDVDGLVKRLVNGDVVVPSFDPEYTESGEVRGFQRQFVWGRPQMDRFLESLLLGLPVPGVFLVREANQRLLVLDGQQRLRTLQLYYSGTYADRTYRLTYAQKPFSGKAYRELDPEDRRRLDNSVIHATVLRQESETGSQDAVYSIFERLNTGGSPLQPQEIRVALNHGPFLRMISSLNEDSDWRTLYGPRSARFKDHELILRVLALFEKAGEYRRPLKQFLNAYLAANRYRSAEDSRELAEAFREAVRRIRLCIGPRAFRPVRPLNAAVLDSTLVGVMRQVTRDGGHDCEAMARAYNQLIANPEYSEATSSSTAAEETVQLRLRLATEAFADIA